MNRSSGFTLFEIVLVLGVIAIVATFSLRSLHGTGAETAAANAQTQLPAWIRETAATARAQTEPAALWYDATTRQLSVRRPDGTRFSEDSEDFTLPDHLFIRGETGPLVQFGADGQRAVGNDVTLVMPDRTVTYQVSLYGDVTGGEP